MEEARKAAFKARPFKVRQAFQETQGLRLDESFKKGVAMPQLRKGRIVHYVHGVNDPYPGSVDPAIILRIIGEDRALVALSVFTEGGATFRDAVRVADGPSSAVRGGAFWPDLNAEADVDIVAAEAVELPSGGGEVPSDDASTVEFTRFPASEGLPSSKVGSALDDRLAQLAEELVEPLEEAPPPEPPAPQEPDEPPPIPAAPI